MNAALAPVAPHQRPGAVLADFVAEFQRLEPVA